MSNLESTDVPTTSSAPEEIQEEEVVVRSDIENIAQQDEEQEEEETGSVTRTTTATQNTNRGGIGNWRDFFGHAYFIYGAPLVSGWVLAAVFLALWRESERTPRGGEILPTPVILKIGVKDYTENEFFKKMYISGNDTAASSEENANSRLPDIRWRKNTGTNNNDFWYLEVSPIRESGKDCPISRYGTFGRFVEMPERNSTRNDESSCNLYDFRLVIFNDLTNEFRHGATVHFHGLTPPSNQDGVPFVSNANIHPQNLQAYRFNQFSYPGLHWMHAHTGFQQAYGVAAPIVLQHSQSYFDNNEFRREDDLVVMLEEGFIYPKCAYSTDWYSTECNEIKNKKGVNNFAKLALFINRRETPVVHTPDDTARYLHIRFLNGGSEAPWRITNTFAESYDGAKVVMEIMATDGHDVERGVKRDEFVLGLANRIDVLLDLRGIEKDILITAVQMKHSGNVTEPALRHIVIRTTKNTFDDGKRIDVTGLPNYYKDQNSPILTNFNLFANLTAAHPLSERKITKTFTIENRGGDQFGGFPLTIYEGLVENLSNPTVSKLKNLYQANTYTELNNLKFQLPPYKVFRNKYTSERISTRRNCTNCATMSKSGIRVRPNGKNYTILYDNDDAKGNNTCCWEWCDVPEEKCTDYEPEDVNIYEHNKHYIPVCFGDRVRFLFINTASFEDSEGHPMHLHGHDFVLRELYDVKKVDAGNYILVKKKYTYDISGPKVDTIWIPFNQAVAFDFDAFNAGEHLFHCHNDFHLENGMMTTVRYMHDKHCGDLPEFVGGENAFPQQICTMNDCTPQQEL